ncbi:MAG: SurA N-terminal domain-containing protein [Desulfosarcina sp.]|nr:SurA N-terminal domain-containing protein [Desulfobacterales bacterium]
MKTLKFVHRVSTIRWHLFVAGLVLVLSPLMPGCQRDNLPNASILMRIGDRVVTVDGFKRDLNIYRTATGTDSDEDANVERELQIRFVRQMADQLVLLEHARAIGIDVTDRDLEIALEEIRRDYPDDVFEQLLLENAITLTEWKASLRTRLIIDRVIQQELEERIRISEEDMARFLA